MDLATLGIFNRKKTQTKTQKKRMEKRLFLRSFLRLFAAKNLPFLRFFAPSRETFGTSSHATVFRLCVLCALCASLLFAAPLHAAAPADFETATHLYEKGDFQGARTAYEALVASGNYNANLFYNLGNADYRLGRKGDAFVAYERALALDPAHPETKANLALLRDETGVQLTPPAWKERVLGWPAAFAGRGAAWIAALAFWVLAFSIAPVFFKPSAEGVRRPAPAWLPAIASLIVLAWTLAALHAHSGQGETWIVKGTEKEDAPFPARLAPADGSEAVANLPIGSHVQLLRDRGPWLYFLLPDPAGEARGWIPRDAVDPVRIATRK